MDAIKFQSGGPCPRPGCKRFRKYGHFACAPCWFALPANYRSAIWAAWALYQSDANCLPQLRDAQQAAADYWDRNPQ